MGVPQQAAAEVRQKARAAAPWVERLARVGYTTRGVVYLLIAAIAARAALRHGQPTDMRGAMGTVEDQPGGDWLVAALAVGFVGFALWRLVQAALDPEGKGRDSQAKGAAHRVRYAASAVLHLGLAYSAARIAMGSGSGGQGGWLQGLPTPSRIVLLAAAAAFVGYGGYQVVRAYRVKLDKQLDLSRLRAEVREWVVRAARAGLTARGVVFGVIGFMLYQMSRHQATDSPGIGGALRTLQQQAYGRYLLGVVAVGLAGYGIFELVRARYRRISPG